MAIGNFHSSRGGYRGRGGYNRRGRGRYNENNNGNNNKNPYDYGKNGRQNGRCNPADLTNRYSIPTAQQSHSVSLDR